MGLPVAALGLLAAAALLLLRGGCGGGYPVRANASLCYYYLEVSEPSQEQPQLSIRSYLDDQPIARFDCLTRKMKPLVPWIEEVEKENFLYPEGVFDVDLKNLSTPGNSNEGLHTWQAILGCELRKDGSNGKFFRYGYDGMDFITFENETLTYKACQPQKENPDWSCRNKDYLEETCIEWLQRYLSYRKKTPKDTKPPVGKMNYTVVNDSLEVLICQAFGFYPKEIQANWMRDGEVCQNETVHRNVAPNSDGTYYVRLSIEINPKERHRFQCHLNHKGLQKPLVLPSKEETGWLVEIFAEIVVPIILCGVILFLIWKYWRTLCQKEISSWSIVSKILITSFNDTEDRIRSEDRASDGGGSFQRAVEDSGSAVVAHQGPAPIVADPNEEEAVMVLHQQPGQQVLESDSKEAEEDMVPEAGIQPGPSKPAEAPSSGESEMEELLPNAQVHRAARRQDLGKRSPRE